MRPRRAFLPAILLTAASAPAWSAPATPAIPCDPPLGHRLSLVMTQDMFLANGKGASVTVTRTLRFMRNAEGLSVEARIAALDTDDASPGALERLRMAYGEPGSRAILIRLDTGMGVSRIESLDALWTDFRRRQAMLGGAMGKDGASNARALALARMLDAMSVADRIALLSAFLKPVLRYCGTRMPDDAQRSADGMIVAEIRADAGDARDVSRYRIDPHSGLMHSLDRIVTSAAAPLRPLKEHWTLEPLPQ